MQHARQLKGQAVGALEIDRNDGASGAHREARGGRLPRRVRDRVLGPAQVRHLSGGKHGQQSAAGQPGEALSQGPAILRHRALGFEGIHGDEMAAHGIYRGEQRIGANSEIRPHHAQQDRENEAFRKAEGMIGHHHRRPLRGNALDIARLDRETDVQGIQEAAAQRPGRCPIPRPCGRWPSGRSPPGPAASSSVPGSLPRA